MFNRHRFFRGPMHEHPFQKGDLKYIILDLIKDKPRYGYEIIRVLEERSHGFYAPSPGAVYPTLQLLEEIGHVSATQQDSKKIYTITDDGRRFLGEREQFAEEIKSQMRDFWNPENMSEMGEIMRMYKDLRHLLHRQARIADADQIRRIREIISRTYNEIEDILK